MGQCMCGGCGGYAEHKAQQQAEQAARNARFEQWLRMTPEQKEAFAKAREAGRVEEFFAEVEAR